jgi:hypothetical protein
MSKRHYFNLILAIFAITYCIAPAFAEKTISGSKDLPLEINLLVDSLQLSSPENYKQILPLVMNIDLYARSMSKEDIFLIGKIEVYKTLLKNYAAPNKTPIDGTTVSLLRSSMGKTNDNFVKWFLQALLKDSLDLTDNPAYKEFILQKNASVKNEKIEYRKLEKKAELIQFWVSKITPESLDSFKNELNPKMLEALKNIQNSFYLMAKEASMTPLASSLTNISDLKFFTIKDIAPVKVKAPVAAEQKSVEEILAPITDISPIDLPKPTEENWIEDENTPPSMQNLPKPSNDAEWLQDF